MPKRKNRSPRVVYGEPMVTGSTTFPPRSPSLDELMLRKQLVEEGRGDEYVSDVEDNFEGNYGQQLVDLSRRVPKWKGVPGKVIGNYFVDPDGTKINLFNEDDVVEYAEFWRENLPEAIPVFDDMEVSPAKKSLLDRISEYVPGAR